MVVDAYLGTVMARGEGSSGDAAAAGGPAGDGAAALRPPGGAE
jgi:hypothetical protein